MREFNQCIMCDSHDRLTDDDDSATEWLGTRIKSEISVIHHQTLILDKSNLKYSKTNSENLGTYLYTNCEALSVQILSAMKWPTSISWISPPSSIEPRNREIYCKIVKEMSTIKMEENIWSRKWTWRAQVAACARMCPCDAAAHRVQDRF